MEQQDEFGLFGSDSDESGHEADLERYTETEGDDDDPDKEKKKISSLTSKLSPEELFRKFDADESGLINEDEFIAMLPHIGIHVSTAKAIRIFKRCDTDGGGEIDIDEFKMALFACDPNSGNTLGFSPSNLLGPRDAFDLFDEDGTGEIDELEFADVLEYLGMDVSDEKQEAMFRKYDKDKSGYIDYNEFRTMWVRLSNVRGELEARNIEIPKNARESKLQQMLEEILDQEERKEHRALEEAKWWHAWHTERDRRSKLGQRALYRARDELAEALDASGQVYIIGRGKNNKFDGTSELFNDEFYGKDIVETCWTDRVNPTYERPQSRRRKMLHATEEEDLSDAVAIPIVQGKVEPMKRNDRVRRRPQKDINYMEKMNKLSFQRRAKKILPVVADTESLLPPSREATPDVVESDDMNDMFYQDRQYIRSLRFKSLRPKKNTVWLWGRRVVQGTFGENVAFALTDSGQVFAFGGNNLTWNEVDPESEDEEGKMPKFITPRSSLLKLFSSNKPDTVQAKTQISEESSNDDNDYLELKRLYQYFEVWESPPSYSTRYEFLQQVILPRLDLEEIRQSMDIRGHSTLRLTKSQLIEIALQSFHVEEELFNDEERSSFHAGDLEYRKLIRDKQIEGIEIKRLELIETWSRLMSVFEERQDELHQREKEKLIEEHERQEQIYFSRVEEDRVRREDPFPLYTERGQSFKIEMSGITSRGKKSNQTRGEALVWKIAAGGHHAALLTHSGFVYTWGTDTLGQLGQGSRSSDISRPQRLPSLKDIVVEDIDCSPTFSCAVAYDGRMYSWGSLAAGQLGVGDMKKEYLQYSTVPLPVKLSSTKRIRQVSCGSTHAAAVSTQGDLYVWGCANGYRLGLGESITDCVQQPVYVKQLRKHRVWQVSCGNSHTALCTEVKDDGSGSDDNISGGEIFVCGNNFALGKMYTTWTKVESLRHKHIKQVSCGYSHTAAVTINGELYTWGSNIGGCTGHDEKIRLVEQPQQLEAFYKAPRNLSRGCPCRQSSIYNNQGPERAVNGERSGRLSTCIHTQYDDRPWWEVDLGQASVIKRIRVWNRTDTPREPSRPQDEYSSRLVPFYILISEIPFNDLPGNPGLRNAIKVSSTYQRFDQVDRMIEWVLPRAETVGQYVRIQVDSTNFLHIAEVEVFGVYNAFKHVGTVDSVTCGNEVTMVIMKSLVTPSVIEDHFVRAVQADADNAKILRQYGTYVQYYEKYTTGESLVQEQCRLCRSNYECEICHFYNETPAAEFREGEIGERLGLAGILEAVKQKEPPRLEWSDDEDDTKKPPSSSIRSATKFLLHSSLSNFKLKFKR